MGSKYIICLNERVSYQEWIERDWIKNGLMSMLDPNNLRSNDPWYQTKLGEDHLQMLGCVAGEFYRLAFDSKFDLLRLRRGRGKDYQVTKKSVALNAQLWVKVWQMLERMESMGKLPPPPHMLISQSSLSTQAKTPLWFLCLVLESELLTPWASYLPPDGSIGFEALRKQQQNVNGKLMSLDKLENPFVNEFNRLFVETAIAVAENFDRFRTDFYNPMVKQRQAVTNFMVKHDFKAFGTDGKQSRQGRRKKIR
jgi:hypothetical protein